MTSTGKSRSRTAVARGASRCRPTSRPKSRTTCAGDAASTPTSNPGASKPKAAVATSGPARETGDATRLDGLAGIRAEMAGIYRDARSGKLDPDRAKNLMAMLVQIRGVLEAEIEERKMGEHEERLAKLEALLR